MQDTLENLPPELARHRVLNTAETAAFCKLSVPHWRRLYNSGRAPHPIRLGTRKLGWRVGDVIDWLSTVAKES
jgi:predicted DNA-binding transcriptional regulator AlpA